MRTPVAQIGISEKHMEVLLGLLAGGGLSANWLLGWSTQDFNL